MPHLVETFGLVRRSESGIDELHPQLQKLARQCHVGSRSALADIYKENTCLFWERFAKPDDLKAVRGTTSCVADITTSSLETEDLSICV